MIMKQKAILLIACISLASQANKHQPIKLELQLIKHIDGNMFDGQSVMFIKKYQSQIMNLLVGSRTAEGKRIGNYLSPLNNKTYSVQELRELEQQGKLDTATVKVLIEKMRHDFERISEEFREMARGMKSTMALLIEEDFTKRKRTDSLLVKWGKTKETSEHDLFKTHICSIKDFESFITDLYNFLNDLVHSCPKALKQFQELFNSFKEAQSKPQSKL